MRIKAAFLFSLAFSFLLSAQTKPPCIPNPFDNCISTAKPVTNTQAPITPIATVLMDPSTLLGNPLRLAPAYPNYAFPPPLNLDAAIAAGMVKFCLGCYPYPYPVVAGPYAPNAWAANMQAGDDWSLVTYFAGWQVGNPNGTPPPQQLANWATWTGDAFVFQGVTYKPTPVVAFCNGSALEANLAICMTGPCAGPGCTAK